MQESSIASTVSHLEELIGFDTVSHKSNLPLIERVREHLRACGVTSTLDYDVTGEKANLLATIGPEDRQGLVLSGHTDVVPVDGQAWSSDPFVARIDNGLIYGRGAADMKGFLAVVLGLVPELARRQLKLPVHIAFSYDEEVGCKGVGGLIDHIETSLPCAPLGCIVGEPTMMRPLDGHKGKMGVRCTVRGLTGHSALTHKAVNAVAYAGRILEALHRMGRQMSKPTVPADGFEPPFSTVSAGRIEGGSQVNIVPDRCVLELEFRTLPGEHTELCLEQLRRVISNELEPEMRAVSTDTGIDLDTFITYPGFAAPPGSPFVRACLETLGTQTCIKGSFGTEAGWFQARGIDSLVCGPGDIGVAHKADEHVAIAQLEASRAFLLQLIDRLGT